MHIHPLRAHIEEVLPLTDQEFDFILSHFTPLSKRKHQYLVQEGELVDKEHWVIKGCLKAYFFDQNGKEYIVQFAMENWWITDYEAFNNQVRASFSVDCIENCELLAIDYASREKLSSEMHKMERFWAKKTKLAFIASQKRILSLCRNTAKERYEMLLNQYPQLVQRVPKKMLASYLGVSRETLSRL